MNAFSECTNLKTVTIPISVKRIESNSFAECSSLTDIFYSGTQSDWDQIFIESYNSGFNRSFLCIAIIFSYDGRATTSFLKKSQTEIEIVTSGKRRIPQNCTVIVLGYDKNGILVGYNSEQFSGSDIKSSFNNGLGVTMVKVLTWYDMDCITPIGETEVLENVDSMDYDMV